MERGGACASCLVMVAQLSGVGTLLDSGRRVGRDCGGLRERQGARAALDLRQWLACGGNRRQNTPEFWEKRG